MIIECLEEKFENPKGVIRHPKEKKDNQYNGQRRKKGQRTNNDLRNIAYKTKDRATRTLGAPEG